MNKTNHLASWMGFKAIFEENLYWCWWTSPWVWLILWLLIPLDMDCRGCLWSRSTSWKMKNKTQQWKRWSTHNN